MYGRWATQQCLSSGVLCRKRCFLSGYGFRDCQEVLQQKHVIDEK